MNQLLLRQVLGGVLGQAMARRGMRGGMGTSMGGSLGGGALGGGLGGAALGSVLGGMLGGGRGRSRMGGGLGGRGALLALMLPLAMRWVQQNGGVGAVLERFKEKGYRQQAASWVEPGENQPLDVEAVDQVVGREELARLSQQLGVAPQEVAQGFAEILPEMVDQVTPEGRLDPEADDVLEDGRNTLEGELRALEKEHA